jgi:hypothetical protein
MTRPLAILAAAVLLLGAWNLLLDRTAARTRAAESRVGALFTAAEAAELRKQPALRIELAGEAHAYGRVQGRWRCLSLHRSPADGRALQGLLDAIVRAEGLVHAREVEEAPRYGINAPETIRVSLQGPRATQDPGGDVLATLEIGKVQPGRDLTFVRRKGTKEIWAVAGDLRGPIERRIAPGLPPLLAVSALPDEWLEESGGTVRVEVERGPARFVLERRERELDPEQARPGDLPWTWFLDPGPAERELAAAPAASYLALLERLPYVEVLDPARRDALGLASPAATITLHGRTGAPLQLVSGAPGKDGRVPLWVEASQALYRVAGHVLDLVAPDASSLAEAGEEGDPWTAFLRAEER